MRFPNYRPRRLRKNAKTRGLIQETALRVEDLIYPLFVVPGSGVKQEIPTLDGQYHLSVDRLEETVKEIDDLGIPGVILFGIPECKDAHGSEACKHDGVIQQAIREIKDTGLDLIVITDVCLCEYTDHGHCGLIKDGEVDNDSTCDMIARSALSHVVAGADMVAPSDMMDGRVRCVRETLDDRGYCDTPIMAYSAKYCSSFYGPFRVAVDSAPQFGDRKPYQMDPPNWREAMREVELDIKEGADIIMIKPALPYLDIISRVRSNFRHPVAAYQVSGEYAMIRAAAKMGWLDGDSAMMEALIGIKRAGADMIITYSAPEIAKVIG